MNTTLIVMFLLFMSVVFGVYFIFPKNKRYIVLLVASLLFYAIYSKLLTLFMLSTIVSIYFAGIGLNKLDDKFETQKQTLEKPQRKILKAKFKKKKTLIVASAIVLNLAFIAVLKYSGMFADIFEGILSWFKVTKKLPVLKIGLPLGISYYTLSAIGYLVDVKRGKYRAETNVLKVALFISYFPQLLEGPFATYDKQGVSFYEGHDYDTRRCSEGLLTVLWGFFKKIVIADRLAIIASEVFKNYADYNGLFVAIGVLAFTFQLYAEFSGLIDVAIGISKMFGIELAKNFEQPFFSKNVNEFWRRWHISLGAWFREYLFYPISMSKPFMSLTKKLHGKVNPFFEAFIPSMFALFFVWFANGLWHGASLKYVVYGLYYYVIMMIGTCLDPLSKKLSVKLGVTPDSKKEKVFNALRIARTFLIVNLGFIIFRATDLATAGKMFAGLFGSGKPGFNAGVIDAYDLALCILGVIILIVTDTIKEYKIDVKELIVQRNSVLRYAVYLSVFFIIVIFGAYGQGYIPVDPIYGGF